MAAYLQVDDKYKSKCKTKMKNVDKDSLDTPRDKRLLDLFCPRSQNLKLGLMLKSALNENWWDLLTVVVS